MPYISFELLASPAFIQHNQLNLLTFSFSWGEGGGSLPVTTRGEVRKKQVGGQISVAVFYYT